MTSLQGCCVVATWGEGGCGVLLTSIIYLWAPSVQEVSVCEGGLDRTKAPLIAPGAPGSQQELYNFEASNRG